MTCAASRRDRQSQVSFELWLTSQPSRAAVQVSVDGTTWLTVGTVAPSDSWTEQTFDLSAYAGQEIELQFVWQGSGSLSAARRRIPGSSIR